MTFKIKGISETLLAVYSHIGRVLQLLCRVLPISSRTFAGFQFRNASLCSDTLATPASYDHLGNEKFLFKNEHKNTTKKVVFMNKPEEKICKETPETSCFEQHLKKRPA